jgi:hypothetical protein
MDSPRDSSTLQKFLEQLQNNNTKIRIHPHHTMATTRVVVHAGEDFVAIKHEGKQSIIPYNATWKIDIEE